MPSPARSRLVHDRVAPESPKIVAPSEATPPRGIEVTVYGDESISRDIGTRGTDRCEG